MSCLSGISICLHLATDPHFAVFVIKKPVKKWH